MSRPEVITIQSVNEAFSAEAANKTELLKQLLAQIESIRDEGDKQRAKNNIFLLKDSRGRSIADMAMAQQDGPSCVALLKILHGETLGQVLHNGTLNYVQCLNLINFASRDRKGEREAATRLALENYPQFLKDAKRSILMEALEAKDEKICLTLLQSGTNLEGMISTTDPDNTGDKALEKPLLSALRISDKAKTFYLSCVEKLQPKKESASAGEGEGIEWDFSSTSTQTTREEAPRGEKFTPSKSFKKKPAGEETQPQQLASTSSRQHSPNDIG